MSIMQTLTYTCDNPGCENEYIEEESSNEETKEELTKWTSLTIRLPVQIKTDTAMVLMDSVPTQQMDHMRDFMQMMNIYTQPLELAIDLCPACAGADLNKVIEHMKENALSDPPPPEPEPIPLRRF